MTEDDGTWVLQYPHAHHVLLHAETDVERCLDIADGRELPTPNQHNNMHIGSPGQDTWGGFSKAGHEIHIGSCAEAGFD